MVQSWFFFQFFFEKCIGRCRYWNSQQNVNKPLSAVWVGQSNFFLFQKISWGFVIILGFWKQDNVRVLNVENWQHFDFLNCSSWYWRKITKRKFVPYRNREEILQPTFVQGGHNFKSFFGTNLGNWKQILWKRQRLLNYYSWVEENLLWREKFCLTATIEMFFSAVCNK